MLSASDLRAAIIQRMDALIGRDIGAFMHELGSLRDLVPECEPAYGLEVGNGSGGPPPLVCLFPAPVMEVLMQLFAEGLYSAKVVEGHLAVMTAVASCPEVLPLPVMLYRGDFSKKQQHWLVMSLHKGMVPDSGHWVTPAPGASSFHWAPKADCSVCANVPAK